MYVVMFADVSVNEVRLPPVIISYGIGHMLLGNVDVESYGFGKSLCQLLPDMR